MLLKNFLLGATLVTSAAAHPWMARDDDSTAGAPSLEKKGCPFGFDKVDKRDGESHEDLVKRQLLGLSSEDGLLGLGLEETLQNALGGVGGLLEGLLGSVAQLGNGETKVPDENHPFQAPGPTDQRGPCPGLNALANHGYISRNGIVTAGEVIQATAEGFNMGTDLSTLLIFIATAFGGNIESLVFSIGGEDDRTYSAAGIGSREAGRQLGLDGHSRCEGDISATRRDFATNNGDNHNAYPDRFKRYIELAKQNGGEFNLAASNQFYGQNAQESINNNDKLFFNSYTIVVVLGEYPFLPAFFGNGTEGAGGVANYESMSSFLGMQANADGTICYVPERFPENWYRRATPYGVAQLVAGLGPTYLTGPELVLPTPLGSLQNLGQASEIGCAIYQGVTSGIPAALLGETNDKLSQTITFIQNQLLPQLPNVYGCSPSSPSLQENGTGGGQDVAAGVGSQRYSQICA